MEKHRSKLLLAFTLLTTLVIAGLIFAGTYRIGKPKPQSSSFAAENPTPTPENFNSKEEILSPDGKYSLIKVNKTKENGNIAQTFSIRNETDKTSIVIFEKESVAENLITVPYNTFSPTDKYLFLQYQKHGKKIHIVLRTDGKDMTKDQKFVELEESFYEKYPDFEITEVTGWGGYGLVVFNTNGNDGKTDPSWWFDTSSLSFIRLSTRFN